MPGRLRFLAVALAAVAMLAQPVPAAAAGEGGAFNVPCPYSRSLRDDPVVHPRRPGASHLHDFTGNKTTDAFSTVRSLVGRPTTCKLSSDSSAYWFPALYSNDRHVRPSSMTAYYGGQNEFVDPATVVKPPRGFVMIGGYQADATRRPRLTMQRVFWECDGSKPQYPRPPSGCDRSIELDVRFPFCWDGKRRDSPDHRSHVVYPIRGVGCPRSHPVPIPRLRYRIEYPITDGSTITFASGPWWTVHGDFWNTWRQPAFERLVTSCINTDTSCGRQIDGGG